MKNNRRTTEVGWLPLKDSYEEAVLNWYEQVEISFRRRRLDTQRVRGEQTTRRQLMAKAGQTVFD